MIGHLNKGANIEATKLLLEVRAGIRLVTDAPRSRCQSGS